MNNFLIHSSLSILNNDYLLNLLHSLYILLLKFNQKQVSIKNSYLK